MMAPEPSSQPSWGRSTESRVVRRSVVRDQSGIALILVLSVISMLSIVVMEFTHSVTIDQYRVRNSLHALQSELLVRSGVNIAEGFLALDEDEGIDTYTDEWFWAMQQQCQEGIPLPNGSIVRCAVKDESGKINVNNTRTRRGAPIVPGNVTKEAILLDALRCIFQLGDGLDGSAVDDLKEYWQRDPPTLGDGTQRNTMPSFGSLEAFAAALRIPTKHIRLLRKYLTAQPPRRQRGVNINTADQVVLSAILQGADGSGVECGPTQEVQDILERQLDPEDPIKPVDIRTLIGGIPNGSLAVDLFVSNSSIYRLEASALTNVDPENRSRGGVGKTLSVLVFRKCVEKEGDKCIRWTSTPLDWQKEGGARLFREKNRFSALSEYYGDFDPSNVSELFN